MESDAFIIHVRTHLRNELQNAIIQQASNRFCSILCDSDKDIRVSADIIGAKYWVRLPCTIIDWQAYLAIIEGINVYGSIRLWTFGCKNHSHVRIVPNVKSVAEVLDPQWLTHYIGHACVINGHSRYDILGSKPKSTSITHAGILVAYYWNGKNVRRS